MSGQPTPGPWELHVLEWGWIIRVPQEGCEIARARFDENVLTNRRQLADARLVAAAPELFEVVKAMMSLLEDWHEDDGRASPIWRKCKQAIAKAEGHS